MKLALTVLRLPPGLQPVGGEGGDHILDAMVAHLPRLLHVGLHRIAHKALFLLLVKDTQDSQGLKLKGIPRIPLCSHRECTENIFGQ